MYRLTITTIDHGIGRFTMSTIMHREVEDAVQISYEARLISHNEDASKKIFMATEVLVFDFEVFIGGLFISAFSNKWISFDQD